MARDQGQFPGIYARPTPPRRGRRWIPALVTLVIVVGVAVGLSSLHGGGGSVTSNSGNSGNSRSPTSTTIGTTPQTSPAGYAAEACSIFERADLYYNDPHNLGEVATAQNIERVANLADQGDDADFGALAGDAVNLYIDVSSLSGGYASDGPDTALLEECNTLVSNGLIHLDLV